MPRKGGKREIVARLKGRNRLLVNFHSHSFACRWLWSLRRISIQFSQQIFHLFTSPHHFESNLSHQLCYDKPRLLRNLLLWSSRRLILKHFLCVESKTCCRVGKSATLGNVIIVLCQLKLSILPSLCFPSPLRWALEALFNYLLFSHRKTVVGASSVVVRRDRTSISRLGEGHFVKSSY